MTVRSSRWSSRASRSEAPEHDRRTRDDAGGGPRRRSHLLPAPRPRDLHLVPALRAPDLPRLHARRGRGVPVPDLRRRGRKETRAGRTPYGGLRPARQGVVSMTLIGINAAIWVLILATGGAGSRWVDRLALRPKGLCVIQRGGFDVSQAAARPTAAPGCPASATVPPGSWSPACSPRSSCCTSASTWWRCGCSGHSWSCCSAGCATPASTCSPAWSAPRSSTGSPASTRRPLGASGAIFGLMGALLVMAYKVRADMNQLLVWIGLNVAITFFGRSIISWQGHLGGFVGGVLLAVVLAYAPRSVVRRGRPRASRWSARWWCRRGDPHRRPHLAARPQGGDEPGRTTAMSFSTGDSTAVDNCAGRSTLHALGFIMFGAEAPLPW